MAAGFADAEVSSSDACGEPEDSVRGQRLLRYATGKAITSRRYDYLRRRLGGHLPRVAAQQVSMHWIRHTVLT